MENFNSAIGKKEKNLNFHITCLILIFVVCLVIIPNLAYAEIKSVKVDTYFYIDITYPTTVILDDKFTLTFIIRNTGSSADIENIIISVDGQKVFIPIESSKIKIQRLAPKGSYGTTLDFLVPLSTTQGKQFFNINFTTSKDDGIFYNTIIPIMVTDQRQLVIRIITPDAIFTNAQFPFTVEIEGQGTNVKDVTVHIIPPEEITFRGEKQHVFSSIPKNTPVSIRAQLITLGQGEIDYEQFIPFTVNVEYTDDDGEKKKESKTVSLLLRPRTHFELGSNAGLWIGDFYLAPTISIGTIIAIPVGAIFSYYFRKWWQKRDQHIQTKNT